jgi:hypothetical protein
VRPLVPPVLLGVTRLDALDADPEPDPPDRRAGESSERGMRLIPNSRHRALIAPVSSQSFTNRSRSFTRQASFHDMGRTSCL